MWPVKNKTIIGLKLLSMIINLQMEVWLKIRL